METNPVSRSEFLFLAQELYQNQDFYGVFICSDETEFIELARSTFHDVKVTSIEQTRVTEQDRPQFTTVLWDSDSARELALYAIADVLALSRCGHVMKGSSAFSAWAKILRPQCQLHQVSITRPKWFPVGAVPAYEPLSAEAKEILKRTYA